MTETWIDYLLKCGVNLKLTHCRQSKLDVFLMCWQQICAILKHFLTLVQHNHFRLTLIQFNMKRANRFEQKYSPSTSKGEKHNNRVCTRHRCRKLIFNNRIEFFMRVFAKNCSNSYETTSLIHHSWILSFRMLKFCQMVAHDVGICPSSKVIPPT